MTELEVIAVHRSPARESVVAGAASASRKGVVVLLFLVAIATVNADERAKADPLPAGWLFKTLDRDANGQLSQDEVAVALQEPDQAGIAEAFQKGDVDRNETLSPGEFEALSPDMKFRLLDRDWSGELSSSEVMPQAEPKESEPLPAASNVKGQRVRCLAAFEATDRDRSGRISGSEFRNSRYLSALLGGDPAGVVPDPVLEQASETLEILFPAGQERRIALSDWPKTAWDVLGADWRDLAEARPDKDGDGQIARDEAREAIEVALGIRRPDGTLIRLATGRIFANVDFEDLDRDRDGRLTLAEYSARYQPSPEVAKERFAAFDTDKDAVATPAELISLMRVDLVTTFQHFDVDGDGRVTGDELAKQARPWEQYTLLGLFPGFDENKDGWRSSFRMEPTNCPRPAGRQPHGKPWDRTGRTLRDRVPTRIGTGRSPERKRRRRSKSPWASAAATARWSGFPRGTPSPISISRPSTRIRMDV